MDFGMVLGFKSEPNRYKIALNIATQDDHQKKTLSDRLQMDFWSILASILGPRSAQDLPFWSQDRLQTPNFGAKIGPRPPTWSQDGPKTLSRHLRGPILEDFGPILMDLGFQFNDFFFMLVDFGHQLMTQKYTNHQNCSSEDTKQIVKLFIIISKLH